MNPVVSLKSKKLCTLKLELSLTHQRHRCRDGGGGGGGAPVTHGCHGKDASHMKHRNCTISLA